MSVFFSSDTANPDTYPHFYCDAQMYNTTMPQADPQLFMNQYVSWQVANKENKWQGRNVSRWQNKEYDELYKQAEQELDAVKRAAMFIRLNDLVVKDNYIQPILSRTRVAALANKLTVHISGWDNDLWQLASWYREACGQNCDAREGRHRHRRLSLTRQKARSMRAFSLCMRGAAWHVIAAAPPRATNSSARFLRT
jgi:hypothetical protein